jgi:hypothetical protein
MRKLIPAILISAMSICSYSFSLKTTAPVFHFNYAKTDTASRPPQFKDGGNTVKKLKDEYNCEAVEFENWEEDDAIDSSLTVCLVNSKRVSPANQEQTFNQLKAIASTIKNALKYPERYNSYYIIFVKRENVLGMATSSHTAGATIQAKEL